MKFSVLMSIYQKENPEYLAESIESILYQTVKPDEIIIVEDGPLTESLYAVLDSYAGKCSFIRRVPFKENRGLGLALRDGVLACKNEWIARMDTDDVAKPERFEKQVTFLKNHPEISLLGTGIEEFSKTPDKPDSITILPETPEEILKFAKKRNPFRHMTVMFRRSAVLASGNYRHFLWFEDYDLWVRMFTCGYKTANLPEVLVSVRADAEMFARRGGWGYLKQDIHFQLFMYQIGFINLWEFSGNVVIRSTVRLMPNQWRKHFYAIFLRNRRE